MTRKFNVYLRVESDVVPICVDTEQWQLHANTEVSLQPSRDTKIISRGDSTPVIAVSLDKRFTMF